jgi:hypothetical protein
MMPLLLVIAGVRGYGDSQRLDGSPGRGQHRSAVDTSVS